MKLWLNKHRVDIAKVAGSNPARPTQACQTSKIPEIGISRAVVKSIADSLAEEMATKMYYKLMMVKSISEIKAVESGKLKGLKGKEIDKFLKKIKD